MLMNNGFDTEKMNNIKNLVDSGNINEAISQISPEMIENFSKMMNSSNSKSSKDTSTYNKNTNDNNQKNASNNADFSNIDMNTILKMKSVMENMNNKNDPRSNLLNSIKPYLRDTKKEKLDQYVNLLYFSKIAEMFNNNNKKDD